MEQITQNYSLKSIDDIARKLYDMRSLCKVYTFSGDLGAGKTTLIQHLLRQWGVQEHITSPTFTYVNHYVGAQGERLYHFDVYRLESLEEFMALGFDEYLYQPGSYTFIEWPGVIQSLLARNRCDIHIDHVDQDQRSITISRFTN